MVLRIITGVIGIAIAAAVIQMGGLLFALASLLLMLLAYHEYVRALKNIRFNPDYPAALAALVIIWLGAYFGGLNGFLAAATLSVLGLLSLPVFRFGQFALADALATVAGVMYVGLSLPCLLLLRFCEADTLATAIVKEIGSGCALVWLTFIGTWASDTFAYFAGRFFGQHKLCPAVSPKKTIEGFIGGAIGTIASVFILGNVIGLPFFTAAFLGFGLAVVAPLGDLVESAIKRYAGIKDSGSLIPGHGGVLDRFDSVIFTAPFAYYFLHFCAGIK